MWQLGYEIPGQFIDNWAMWQLGYVITGLCDNIHNFFLLTEKRFVNFTVIMSEDQEYQPG